jgi:hypothetical protein
MAHVTLTPGTQPPLGYRARCNHMDGNGVKTLGSRRPSRDLLWSTRVLRLCLLIAVDQWPEEAFQWSGEVLPGCICSRTEIATMRGSGTARIDEGSAKTIYGATKTKQRFAPLQSML